MVQKTLTNLVVLCTLIRKGHFTIVSQNKGRNNRGAVKRATENKEIKSGYLLLVHVKYISMYKDVGQVE